jgi:uncharacterized protein involved in exopolysaccharide biosynthesis
LGPKIPSKRNILLLAIIAGLGVGVGLVYGLEYIDTSFKSVEDVEQFLSLPVIGTIPSMPLLKPRKDRKPIVLSTLAMIAVLATMYAWYYMRTPR